MAPAAGAVHVTSMAGLVGTLNCVRVTVGTRWLRRLGVRHLDNDVDRSRVTVNGVVHFPAVELGDHLAIKCLRFPVGIVRVVVQRGALWPP